METTKPMLIIGSVKTKDHLPRLMESLKKGGFAQKDLAIIAPGDEKKMIRELPWIISREMIQPTKRLARVPIN